MATVDQTWTLLGRLWKRIAMNRAHDYIAKARTVMPTLTDEQLRELYARYCECRDIDGAANTARLTHSHDCYCDVLADIRTALHGFIWMDGEPIAVSDATRAAARERLVQAWRDYEEEAKFHGKAQ